MPVNGHDVYHEVRTTTADPITLTVMLFDAAVKSIRKARLMHGEGDNQRYLDACERSYLIVGELLATLDLDWGELPERLAAIYTYCLQQITFAMAGDVTRLDEVEKHISRIGGAWKVAAETYRTSPEAQAEIRPVA